MNYVWDLIIALKKLGIKKEQLRFLKAKSYSPYMELAFEDLNPTFLKEGKKSLYDIEVNPYYRYDNIFKKMYSLDDASYQELKSVLFDIIIHHLADTDSYMGMNKWEFYKKFLYADIEHGYFGRDTKIQFQLFTKEQQQYLLSRILILYKTRESLLDFKEIIHNIYNSSAIYSNKRDKAEILIYLGTRKTKKEEGKIALLLHFFLPMKYEIRVYWDKHFGIIGEQETMKVNQIVMY